jgi:hypothetical protein
MSLGSCRPACKVILCYATPLVPCRYVGRGKIGCFARGNSKFPAHSVATLFTRLHSRRSISLERCAVDTQSHVSLPRYILQTCMPPAATSQKSVPCQGYPSAEHLPNAASRLPTQPAKESESRTHCQSDSNFISPVVFAHANPLESAQILREEMTSCNVLRKAIMVPAGGS